MGKALRGGGHLRGGFFSASVLAALLMTTLASAALARDAYVADLGSGSSTSVSVIDVHTNFVGPPITVSYNPAGIAMSPDGKFAYVTNFGSNTVSVIDTQTNQVVGSLITVGYNPFGIAITPDGRFAYVVNNGSNNVSVIDTQTNQVVGSPIPVGEGPAGIAITPDGRFAYVANRGYGSSNTVSVIDTLTNQVVGPPISVGKSPVAIAITPDGKFAYVANSGPNNVSVIDTQTNQVVGSPIPVGEGPDGIAITPNGKFAYVANWGSDNVSVIDTQTNQVVGSPIPVGEGPDGIAITPDQPPLASFSYPSARPAVPVAFNASASSDPDGSIARYDWAFGDGQTAPDGGPTPSHTYNAPGTYKATLTVTDNEGCSTSFVFTGQTAYCNGSALASQTQTLEVTPPTLKIAFRVKCPKSAKPGGCRFTLQAVTKKRNGKAETGVGKAKVKAGHSKIVSLKPKPRFAAKLAAAKKLLVKETVTINDSKRTLFRQLKVVH